MASTNLGKPSSRSKRQVQRGARAKYLHMTFRVRVYPLSGIVPLPAKDVIAAVPMPIVFDRITTRRQAGVYRVFKASWSVLLTVLLFDELTDGRYQLRARCLCDVVVPYCETARWSERSAAFNLKGMTVLLELWSVTYPH